VPKTATLLGVLRVTVLTVMWIMGRQHQWRGIGGENKHWQKEIVIHWEGMFQKKSAAQVTGQQNWRCILNTLFPQKLSVMNFTNPASMVGLQLLKLWLLRVMLSCGNNGVMTIKPGYQTTRYVHMIWSDESSFMSFPTPGRVYVWRTSMEAYNPECLVPTVKHWGGSVVVWEAISRYSILLVPLLPFTAESLQRSMGDMLGNQVHPMIPNHQCSSPGRQCPHSHSWNCSVTVWRAGRWISTSSQTSTISRFEHHWTSLVNKIPLQTVQNLYKSIPKRTVSILRAKVVQHHINKEMCTISAVFPLFCPNPCIWIFIILFINSAIHNHIRIFKFLSWREKVHYFLQTIFLTFNSNT
jgi:hypothetical protein